MRRKSPDEAQKRSRPTVVIMQPDSKASGVVFEDAGQSSSADSGSRSTKLVS